MKPLKWLLMLSLLLLPVYGGSANASPLDGAQTLVLTKNSTKMMINGAPYNAVQPLTISKDYSYAAFSSLAKLYGYQVSYDAKTKESIAISAKGEIRFKMNTKDILVNGTKWTGEAPAYSLKGSLMIPIRTWALISESKIAFSGKTVTLTWQQSTPSAAFQVTPQPLYAGDPVQYADQYSSPAGLPMQNEEWTGREDVFAVAGTYTVTRRVQDSAGTWSDPYSVTVQVLPVNMPPVADFSTDKTVYRQGEQVQFTDLTTDDNNAIDPAKTKWTGRQLGYFEPGEKTITLSVTDTQGLASTVSKTITITDEELYNETEFGMLYTPVGEKYKVDGGAVLSIPTLSYDFQSEPSRMIRSNSPELWKQEGIAYDDQFSGNIRFLFHNKNTLSYNVRMYLVVTNEGNMPANFSVGAVGTGGPDPSEIRTGKLSTVRYLSALQANGAAVTTQVRPGQSVKVLPQISESAIKPGMVYSAYADVAADQTLRFRVVVVADGKDPLQNLDYLDLMPADGVHTRGSFNNTTRDIQIDGVLGTKEERVVLGDNVLDPYLDGYDNTTGTLQYNVGNFGVLYKMKVTLAPRTIVSLNPRGGLYAGGFLVNGQLVPVTNNDQLKDQNEAAVIYRSGSTQETVELVYMIASGSNLPITMMFQPMPAVKG